MHFPENRLLRIACWGNPDYLLHLSRSVDSRIAVSVFGYAQEYTRQEKKFAADVFLIIARRAHGGTSPIGVDTMLNLRALFDCRQPVLLCSFEGLGLLSRKMDLAHWFSNEGPYIHLRLPISSGDLRDAVSRCTPCATTLDIKPMLFEADLFPRLRHDLVQLKDQRIIRIYKSTLLRYGEME